MTDLSPLATTLLTNFITVRFPRYEPVWSVLDDEDLGPDAYNRCIGHAVRCEELLIRCHRFNLRQGLAEAGHNQFLDHLEADPAGGWRIDLFLADENAIPLLVSITAGNRPTPAAPGTAAKRTRRIFTDG